jgi:hypothetical protein
MLGLQTQQHSPLPTPMLTTHHRYEINQDCDLGKKAKSIYQSTYMIVPDLSVHLLPILVNEYMKKC